MYVESAPASDVMLTDDTVGAVVSIVTTRADEEVCVSVTPSRVVVALALIEYVPTESVPVVHDHSPVVEFVVHVEPVFVGELVTRAWQHQPDAITSHETRPAITTWISSAIKTPPAVTASPT